MMIPNNRQGIANAQFIQVVKRTLGIGIGKTMTGEYGVAAFVGAAAVGPVPNAVPERSGVWSVNDSAIEQCRGHNQTIWP